MILGYGAINLFGFAKSHLNVSSLLDETEGFEKSLLSKVIRFETGEERVSVLRYEAREELRSNSSKRSGLCSGNGSRVISFWIWGWVGEVQNWQVCISTFTFRT